MIFEAESKVIRIGAEAVVSKLEWNGLKLVSKHRVPKPYRMPDLDKWVRDRRTLHEAKIISMLKKSGVPCPAIVLMDRSESTLYMQFIEGTELRNLLHDLPKKVIEALARSLGEIVGRMHLTHVAHGDLTTSNILVDKEGRLYIIDFGLSVVTDDLEELAVDVHLLDRSLDSAHHSIREIFMRNFLKGYSSTVGREQALKIMEKVKEIRRRGRYVEERRKKH
ncbi:MAG: Kae1-associated kinase Bud32 [Thaumarchaeota archaeon]|nr:Kae1-associated kinase Bud32 [Nitrososphaerota archaeon]